MLNFFLKILPIVRDSRKCWHRQRRYTLQSIGYWSIRRGIELHVSNEQYKETAQVRRWGVF